MKHDADSVTAAGAEIAAYVDNYCKQHDLCPECVVNAVFRWAAASIAYNEIRNADSFSAGSGSAIGMLTDGVSDALEIGLLTAKEELDKPANLC